MGVFLATTMLPSRALTQETTDFFRQNCTSCHTIGGGRLVGPDLKDVTKRVKGHGKDREWLISFIVDPKTMLDSGDPYATQLKQQFAPVEMTKAFGINRAWAEKLLDLIDEESVKPQSQFAGLKLPDRDFTPEDIERGRELFLGYGGLTNGGPACISCHSANGVGALGGGRLGPDLTRVFERLKGRKELAAWLSAPATPTMQPVFKKHPLTPEEILPLVAYFEDTARHGREDDGAAPLNFFLLGLGGTAATLVAFDALWRGRFRAVRRTLVHGAASRGEE
jgi:mono/diheme cytochrome c family protein